MIKNLFKMLVVGTLFSGSICAQSPTWADDIAPILYANCTTCHHTGGVAPNSLMTYAQAFNYKNLINTYVQSKYMPPWPADAEYKHLAFERIISSTDKSKISQWVLNGAPQGVPGNAPTPPTYTNNATQLTQINFSAKMADYVVNTSQDLYRCFVIPTNFAVDKWGAEIEVKPGNNSIVHHVLVFEDTAQTIVNLDNADPGVGYTSFFSTGSSTSRLVGEWVPGTAPIKFPPNMGVRLKANSRIILQIHYPGGTFGILDSTRVNIKFAPGSPREVYLAPLLTETSVINPPFVIPANTIKTFTQQYTNNYPVALTMLSVGPHMHLLGAKYKVFAIGLANDTIPLINIPKWDFNWQGVYSFRNPIKLGTAYKIIGQGEYNNTTSNLKNPSNPPITVTQGEATTDEMMLTFFAITMYYPGDENIVVDNSPIVGLKELSMNSIVKTVQLYNVFPNPAKSNAKLSYFSPEILNAKAKIFSSEGKLVKEWNVNIETGFSELDLNIENLSKGQYYINLETKSYTKTLTFLINE